MLTRLFIYLSFFIGCAFISCQIKAQDHEYISLTIEEQHWLDEHKDIIVGVSPDWKSFHFLGQQGNSQGIGNAYLQLISKHTGLNYRVVNDEWQNNLNKIKNDEIHILASVYKTAVRISYLDFSTPYFEALDYFFIRDDLNVNSIADLEGKRLALPKGYAYKEIIKKHFPKITLIDVDTSGAAVDAVLEHRADMLFDTNGSLIYTLELEGIKPLYRLEPLVI